MSIRVTDTSGFKAIGEKLDRVAVAALDELGAIAEGEIKRRMQETVDSRGRRGRVASGTTRQAVVARAPRKTARGFSQVTEVQPPQDKVAVIIEKGRRKGKGVSRAGQRMLARWARRPDKLGPVRAKSGRFKPGGRERAERSRLFLIARAIKRRGIPGIAPFRLTARWLRDGVAKRTYLEVARRILGGAA